MDTSAYTKVMNLVKKKTDNLIFLAKAFPVTVQVWVRGDVIGQATRIYDAMLADYNKAMSSTSPTAFLTFVNNSPLAFQALQGLQAAILDGATKTKEDPNIAAACPVCPECPACPACPACPQGTECPPCPPSTGVAKCPPPRKCPECEDRPPAAKEGGGMTGILIAAAVIGGGFLAYKKFKGNKAAPMAGLPRRRGSMRSR